MGTPRLFKPAFFLVLLLSFSGLRRAEAQVALTTSNDFVAATVSNGGEGLITIFLANGAQRDHLTYADESFLTLQISGEFFTNNPNGPTTVEPSGTQSNPTLLIDGVTTLLKGAMPGTDTIRTVWQPKGPNAFDIVQDVYPVAGISSGQIVYKWSIVNREAAGFTAQAQFLLDIETSSADTTNDNPTVTTRGGYNAGHWQDFADPPPYFVTSEYPLCGSGNFPGVLGAGFTVDDFAPTAMDLMKPTDMAIVDWPTIVTNYLWGFPASRIGTGISDNAMLFQWPSTGVFGAINGKPTVQEIGRGSYGTPPCTPITIGSLDALLLHPDHIEWNGSMYVPNHFPVEAILWGPNNGASGVVATESIANSISGQHSGPVQVLATPIASGGYVQSQLVQSGGSSKPDSVVPACGMAFATWEDTVLQSILTNCTTDSGYDITLSVSASNVQQPIFPAGLPVCPIIVDCQEKDTASTIPIFTVLSRTGSFDGSVCNARIIHAQATDPRLCPLCGVTSVSATKLQNMTFAIEDSSAWKFRVSVIDSMQNGSATVVALDGTGVSDTATYTYCTIPDTTAPLVHLIVCFDSVGGPCDYEVSDTQAWDRGLDSIYFTDVNNVAITPPGNVRGHGVAGFSVLGLGGFCVTAIDLAGNKFDTCFGGASGVSASVEPPLALTISPNPTSGSTQISLSGAPSANVEIFDVLGREVTNFHIEGYYEWQTSLLPAGTYIVRASIGGAVVSKRVVKE